VITHLAVQRKLAPGAAVIVRIPPTVWNTAWAYINFFMQRVNKSHLFILTENHS